MRLVFRDGLPSDHAYVYDSFVGTYRGTPHARGASVATLASLMEPLLAPGSEWRLLVACDPGELDSIVGFIVHRPRPARRPYVAWLQVRGEWKRKGVGRALLAAVGVKSDFVAVTASGVELPAGSIVKYEGNEPPPRFVQKKMEIETPFIVQRIGRERDMPMLVELARSHGITLRFRPYLPLEAARHALMTP